MDYIEWLDLGLVNFESLDQIRNLIGACWFASDLWAFPEMFGAFQCLQGWAPNDDMMGVIPLTSQEGDHPKQKLQVNEKMT